MFRLWFKAESKWTLLYAFLFAGSMLAVAGYHEQVMESPLRVLFALTPSVFLAITLREAFKNVMNLDELEQKIIMESIAISVMVTVVVSFAWIMLEIVNFLPQLDHVWIVVMLVVVYTIAIPFRTHAYD